MARSRKGSRGPSPDQPLTRELRSAIAEDGRNLNALAVAAGVDQAAIPRFVSRERSLSLDSADRVAVALGLSLVRKGRPKGPARVRTADTTPMPVPPPACPAVPGPLDEAGDLIPTAEPSDQPSFQVEPEASLPDDPQPQPAHDFLGRLFGPIGSSNGGPMGPVST